GVPLVERRQLIGLLYAENHALFGAFTPIDIDLIAAFANQTASAIENAKLYHGLEQRVAERTRELQASNSNLEQRNAELAVINSIQEGLVSELNFKAIIDLVGNKVQEIFNISEVEIALYDTATQMISFPFWSTPEGQVHAEPLPLGTGMMSHLIQTGEPFLMTDENKDMVIKTAVVPPGLQLRRSFVGAPIISGSEVLGAISLHDPAQENAYDESNLRLLTTIAASLGTALENARLFDEVQTRNQEIAEALRQQTATSEILRVIASSPNDVQPVFDVIAKNAAALGGSILSSVYRTDGQTIDNVAIYNASPEIQASLRAFYPRPLTRDVGLSAMSIIDRMAYNISEVADDPRIPEHMAKLSLSNGVHSVLFVPIMRQGVALGAIGIQRQEPGGFTDKQESLIKVFADQAVIAIENVRLFNELKTRNQEISEALEQQTATGDILRVIASSPTDIQPVMDVIAEHAYRLCNSGFASVYRTDGKLVYEVATRNFTARGLE
ncbi:MAG TPA: GAF domain-containing protein, partial [Anaerolineae bacterium]|nr:GAF domain-containing protein [Anaerolineae bacterium]